MILTPTHVNSSLCTFSISCIPFSSSYDKYEISFIIVLIS
nr:MAG TPA: hypothetical protein [Caudoviricetes sp.]